MCYENPRILKLQLFFLSRILFSIFYKIGGKIWHMHCDNFEKRI